jgi:hypothetical protein
MTTLPRLIVDLHTHLFNARCVPLAGILANAMKKDADQSALARWVAKLIIGLTESGYTPPPSPAFTAGTVANVDFVILLGDATVHELSMPIRVDRSPALSGSVTEARIASPQAISAIKHTEIYIVLQQIEASLGDIGELEPPLHTSSATLTNFNQISDWARRIIKKAFAVIQKLVDKVDEIGNYAEFCFNMMTSEAALADQLIRAYGTDLPPLQCLHHMMDMQFAYVVNNTTSDQVKPAYDYYDTQLLRVQAIARQHAGEILGFAAFDPRREDWQHIAERALSMGFIGFKFYPAMGYKPFGLSASDQYKPYADTQVIANRVTEFFTWCIKGDIPVFTHCTPVGFETRFKEGLNAHPTYWQQRLETAGFENLRLCFGHGGGENLLSSDHTLHSPGWMTEDDAEWADPNNFARIVSNLCRRYENVYCELAYLTALIESSPEKRANAAGTLQKNLAKACQQADEDKCKFMDKVAYGSDWHMPSMVNHQRDYLDVFLKMFDNNPALSPYWEPFFWRNAYAYLKIVSPSP